MARQSRESLQVAEWLSPADAAERLGVSLRKLQYMAREGEVERKRDGRRSLYWIGTQAQPSASAAVAATAPTAAPRPSLAAPAAMTPQRGITHVATMTLDPVTGELAAVSSNPANRANVETGRDEDDAPTAFEEQVLDAVAPELDAVEAAFEAQILALRTELSERIARLERQAAVVRPAPVPTPRVAGPQVPITAQPVAPQAATAPAPTGYAPQGGVRAGTEYDAAQPGRPPSAHFNSPFHAALEAASRQASSGGGGVGAQRGGYDTNGYHAAGDADVEAAFRSALATRPKRVTPGPIRLAKEAVGWLGSILGWFTGYRPR